VTQKTSFTDGVYAVLGVITLSAAIVLAPFYWAYNIFMSFRNSEAIQEKKARKRTHALYEEAKNLTSAVPDKEPFVQIVYDRIPEDIPDDLDQALLYACIGLYNCEEFGTELPPPPLVCNSIEGARYRDFLSSYTSKIRHPHIAEVAIKTICESFKDFTDELPKFSTEGNEFATIPLSELCDIREPIECLMLPSYSEEAKQVGVFQSLRKQLDKNLHEVSGVPFIPQFKDSPDLILPTDYEGENPAYAYLKDTPLLKIVDVHVPLCVPQKTRFEHHWIVAGTGHGKTQTFQSLILDDLEMVADGNAAVVVIDSQAKLIKNISNLKLFAEGEPLEGKLCLIDPTDTDFPIALNIFNLGMERIKSYSSSDQQRAINTIIDLMEFVLSSLLDAAMTQKQSLLFRFCVRLMLQIPNATILTFRELLEPEGFEKYQQYIQALPDTARGFFETQFNDSKQFGDTKHQVLRRIYGILENQSLERMMAQTESKLDLFTEINKPNVILINISVDFLQKKGTELFGRFFIAMILNATQERATMEKSKHPVFVYIDDIFQNPPVQAVP